ncbi:unnamed protein product [Bursaphelenchus okinawaensis]|uniref:Uncharacterized protein n=1 Tax=Bursaphelenchus okinawaensis TaxID=465554 RepID=A0A811LDU9_9BILA|nr:unnamed protein product [Bursaphelenchus okinawaensis]CAG9121393.1 unnamed protein product [Bursaphelenchus okinawaensis]
MAPPRNRGRPQPSPWDSPSKVPAWGATGRQIWGQPQSSWQQDRLVFGDPYAHQSPSSYQQPYARPSSYDHFSPPSYGYQPRDYAAGYSTVPSYNARLASIPMRQPIKPMFKKPQQGNQQQNNRNNIKKNRKKNNKGVQRVGDKVVLKDGTPAGGRKKETARKPKQKKPAGVDDIEFKDEDSVETLLENAKTLSESSKRHVRNKFVKIFNFNGIWTKTIIEQAGTFNKAAKCMVKFIFTSFFPSFFQFSSNGSDMDNVAFDAAVLALKKLHDLGILERASVCKILSKKHSIKNEGFTRAKLSITVLKEELEKEEFDDEFKLNGREPTPEESEKLQAAIQRAAERIAKDDLPKIEVKEEEEGKEGEEKKSEEEKEGGKEGEEVKAEENEGEEVKEEDESKLEIKEEDETVDESQKEEYELTDEA